MARECRDSRSIGNERGAEVTPKLLTKRVGEHTLTLYEGVRYIASRPLASRDRFEYPVTIEPVQPGAPEYAGWVQVSKLSYEAANALVNAFNDGPTSFDGRVW